MTFKDDHENRVASFAANLRDAHEGSSRHRGDFVASSLCGCFYCLATFPPGAITEWTDHGDTALCQKCGIDSVIGDRSGFPITVEFLASMNAHWF